MVTNLSQLTLWVEWQEVMRKEEQGLLEVLLQYCNCIFGNTPVLVFFWSCLWICTYFIIRSTFVYFYPKIVCLHFCTYHLGPGVMHLCDEAIWHVDCGVFAGHFPICWKVCNTIFHSWSIKDVVFVGNLKQSEFSVNQSMFVETP